MKRTAFKPKLPVPRLSKQYEAANPSKARPVVLHVVSTVSVMVVPIEKRAYVRSKKLMAAYRSIPCQSCSASDGTVCGAHSNWSVHGKGRSIKADDNRCASLCHLCHTELDSGSAMTEAQRRRMWWLAHVDTVKLLIFNGTWPDNVPMPSVHELPREWA